MNQTKKRLSIINHAISITDVETIQLQILKLALLRTDEKIQEIVTAIQAENYAQAQGLINHYIETPTKNILQRTSQKAQNIMSEEDQTTIDEFDLFITPGTQEEQKEIDINDFLLDEYPVETKQADSSDFEALLNIDINNVLPGNIELDITDTSEDAFFASSKEKDKQTIDTSDIPKDTFFDIEETEEETAEIETAEKETVSLLGKGLLDEASFLSEAEPEINVQETADTSHYKAIPYIAQKLISMKKQYPPIEKTYEKFDSVENLLRKISQKGYSEEEIEETLAYIQKLAEGNKETEAAQLLLVCAATESKFAQFMLAREFYKGALLTKNIPEAFTHMHSLVAEDYPEAICDLAQFYEHGVGISKDKKKAEQLYKEAMEFGIKRAEKHHARLKKYNGAFFKR